MYTFGGADQEEGRAALRGRSCPCRRQPREHRRGARAAGLPSRAAVNRMAAGPPVPAGAGRERWSATLSPGARGPAASAPISEAAGNRMTAGERRLGASTAALASRTLALLAPAVSSRLPHAGLAARDSAPLRRPDLAMLDRGRERTAGGVRGQSLLELAGSRLRCGGLAPCCRRRSSRQENLPRGWARGRAE
jgi:hypothetical protein